MSEDFFVILDVFASLMVIIFSVLSLNLVKNISREFRGLKPVDNMWYFFMILIDLFILLGVLRAVLSIGTVVFKEFQPIYDAFLSIILIFYFVFAILLSTSIEEIIE